MPGLKLTISLVAAAAFAIGNYFFGKKDDDDPPPPPPRDPYYSYNSGSWNQTQQTYRSSQQTYRPSPPPSYPHQTPATKARRQTSTWTPASPDYGYGDYQPSAAYTRAPSQTQPSSQTRTWKSTTSPDYGYDDYGLSAAHVRAPSQTQPAIRSQTRTWKSTTPPDYDYDDDDYDLSAAYTRRPIQAQPATRSQTRSWSGTLPDYGYDDGGYGLSAAHVRAPSQKRQSTPVHSSRPYSSFFDTGNAYEPLGCGCSHTSSHVRSHTYTRSDPPPPTVIQVVSSDLLPDEPASVEDLDSAKKLREQARRKGREMSEAWSRAKSAQKKRSGGGAQAHHKQQAIAHEKEMKELDMRAAKIIFKENNKVSSMNVCQRYASS